MDLEVSCVYYIPNVAGVIFPKIMKISDVYASYCMPQMVHFSV